MEINQTATFLCLKDIRLSGNTPNWSYNVTVMLIRIKSKALVRR